MEKKLNELGQPCCEDYQTCIECDTYENCGSKEFLDDGRKGNWIPVIVALTTLSLIVYFLI